MEEVLKIINPMSSTVFWSVIVFVILLVIILKFVAKPVSRILSKRQEEIRENLDSAERKMDEARKYIDEQTVNLEAAKKEARRIIEESREEAKRIRDELEEKANEKSRAIIQTAMQEIENERVRSVEDVKDKIIDIAINASEKIISRQLSDEDHRRLIEESLKEVQEIKQ